MRTAISTVTHRICVADDPLYLTIGQLKRRFGDVSSMWVWRYTKLHGFPRGVKFGGPTSARHWLLSEVEHWEHERIKLAKVRP